MITNSRIIQVGADSRKYHAEQKVERGHPDFVMSASALKEFSRCPSRWKAGYNSPESKATDWGNLVDCLLMTRENFDDNFAVQPQELPNSDGEVKPWQGNRTVCKQWVKDREEEGVTIITAEWFFNAHTALKAVHADQAVSAFIKVSDTQVEVRSEWRDKETGMTIPLKTLLDLVPSADSEFSKCIGDFKTSTSAALGSFRQLVFRLGYHIPAALYTDVYVDATGEDRNTFCYIVQESFAPYQVGKRMLSQDFLDLGRKTYRAALSNYCQCVKTGVWPDYDVGATETQGWSLIEPEEWMMDSVPRRINETEMEFADDMEEEGREEIGVTP